MFPIAAYRFQIAGYRDEVEYKAFRKVDTVSITKMLLGVLLHVP